MCLHWRSSCSGSHASCQRHCQFDAGCCRYEDMDEFEDAMDSTFDEFIARFPIVETKPDERVTGGHVFRVRSHLTSACTVNTSAIDVSWLSVLPKLSQVQRRFTCLREPVTWTSCSELWKRGPMLLFCQPITAICLPQIAFSGTEQSKQTLVVILTVATSCSSHRVSRFCV